MSKGTALIIHNCIDIAWHVQHIHFNGIVGAREM